MTCPSCGESMSTLTTAACSVDVCRHCGGAWFHADELRRLAQADPGALLRVSRARPPGPYHPPAAAMACPRCERRLEPMRLTQPFALSAEVCPGRSGLWLDRQAVCAAQAAAAQRKPPPPVSLPRVTAEPIRSRQQRLDGPPADDTALFLLDAIGVVVELIVGAVISDR